MCPQKACVPRKREDFMLLNCQNWTEDAAYYKEENIKLNFYETASVQKPVKSLSEFPVSSDPLP